MTFDIEIFVGWHQTRNEIQPVNDFITCDIHIVIGKESEGLDFILNSMVKHSCLIILCDIYLPGMYGACICV